LIRETLPKRRYIFGSFKV